MKNRGSSGKSSKTICLDILIQLTILTYYINHLFLCLFDLSLFLSISIGRYDKSLTEFYCVYMSRVVVEGGLKGENRYSFSLLIIFFF